LGSAGRIGQREAPGRGAAGLPTNTGSTQWVFRERRHQSQRWRGDPCLFQARRADIECFARDLEVRGRARATITRRLCTVAGFYRYAVDEDLLEHSPAAHVRRGAGRIVRRVARRVWIAKPVGPHTLRHAFITAALDAGVSLRDVQEAALHADPRTTMRYDRARSSLDRHATYIVAACAAGATR